MPSPGARELVGALRRDQEIPAQRRRHLGLRQPSFHVRYDDWFLASSCSSASSTPSSRSRSGRSASSVTPCAIRIALLAMPSNSAAARVFMVSTEASKPDEPAHEQVLQVGEGRHVAGHHLVADELLELRHRDLERGVELVGRLVLGRAVGLARVAEVVHRAREPRVLDRQEARRWRAARGRAPQAGTAPGASRKARRSARRTRRRAPQSTSARGARPPGVHGREQRVRARRWMPGGGKQLRHSCPLLFRAGRFGRSARDRPHAALVGTGGPLPASSIARSHITSQQRPRPSRCAPRRPPISCALARTSCIAPFTSTLERYA